MSRPKPLSSTAAYRNLDHQLTPRTPHSGSRTSRLEQGFSKIPLSEGNDAEDDDQSTLQSAPLLASSSTARFSANPSRRRPETGPNDRDGKRPIRHPTQMLYHTVSRLPLAFGIFLAGILLILLVFSFMKPDALHRYVGAKAPLATATPSMSSPSASAKPHSSHAHSTSNTNIHIISYENYTTFPLHPTEYVAQCTKQHQGYMSHGGYWDIGPMGAMDVEHAEDDENSPKTVCSSTITYMLDGTVGLTADLALMAQAAALAHERNRTFFVEDTYWNRGKWLDHFEDLAKEQPGPEPGCLPPPPNELVACPRTARHWVITSRTAKYHFGHGFSDNYENPYAHQLNRLKPIFESSGQSLESVIVPNKYNMGLIRLARQEFLSFLNIVDQRAGGTGSPVYVSAHIRRGDRKSLSYSFPNQRIPVQDYSEAVSSTWKRLHPDAKSNPVVYLATDSPQAYDEFSTLYQGELFSLLDTADPRLRSLVSPGEYFQKTFNELDVHERITATRGMIVDLALVSGLWPDGDTEEMLPRAVICALSSTVCRLSAVGLGWTNAFGHVDQQGYIDEKNKGWVDIDEKGQVVPVWQAFELF